MKSAKTVETKEGIWTLIFDSRLGWMARLVKHGQKRATDRIQTGYFERSELPLAIVKFDEYVATKKENKS